MYFLIWIKKQTGVKVKVLSSWEAVVFFFKQKNFINGLEFLKPNQMMNSDLYCKLLKKKALKIVKQRNLIILHDRSNIHSSRKTEAFLKTERMKSIKLPGKSYDLNPIEKVRRLWTGMSNDYLF